MEAPQYDATARRLHWLSAAVIVWALVTGFAAAMLPEGSAIRAITAKFNIGLTLLFTPVFAWRIVRATRRRVPAPAGTSPARWRVACLVHGALYASTATVLVSGLLVLDRDGALYDPAHAVHRAACMLLSALIALHVAAVLHHATQGSSVLERMLPAGRRVRTRPPGWSRPCRLRVTAGLWSRRRAAGTRWRAAAPRGSISSSES